MTDIAFDTIEQVACERLGGQAALQERLVSPEPPESLAMIGDDRYLSVMSRRIFRAGLTHRLVDARWPAFEAAFMDFAIADVSHMNDNDMSALMQNQALIRNRSKLLAVRDNAIAMQAVAEEHGSFGVWLAQWPEDEIVDLWHALRSRFRQLGGRSAPAFLRMAGKDTFMLTDWVVAALAQWGQWHGRTTSHSAQRAIQALFNQWQTQSDRPLCQISQILALSVSDK